MGFPRVAVSDLGTFHGISPSLWITENRAVALIKKYIKPTQKVLDLGAGGGELLQALSKEGYTVLEGLDKNISKNKTKFPMHEADFSYDTFPFEDGTFDAAISFETIEHIRNPHHFVSEIARITKDNGIVMISTPNILHLFNRISFLLNGEMYRFNYRNDHWSMFPNAVWHKTFLPHFELIETNYLRGEFPYRWLSKFPYPENKLFGRSVCWILRKKPANTNQSSGH